MTMPKPGKAQLYIGKFEDEDDQRLRGENDYVIRIEKDVPAKLFWSIVGYDADTRCIIDNRSGTAGGKATAGSKTKSIRKNTDGSYYVLLGPDAPPEGWEANHVHTLPVSMKAALAHFQFETTHPFLDGRRRLSRLLITPILCAEDVPAPPFLFLSLLFKRRQEYYDRLDAVCLKGGWLV